MCDVCVCVRGDGGVVFQKSVKNRKPISKPTRGVWLGAGGCRKSISNRETHSENTCGVWRGGFPKINKEREFASQCAAFGRVGVSKIDIERENPQGNQRAAACLNREKRQSPIANPCTAFLGPAFQKATKKTKKTKFGVRGSGLWKIGKKQENPVANLRASFGGAGPCPKRRKTGKPT